MKLRGLTKLALSGVALAAVAATLGTSTYAWYVTNSEAKVDGVQGAAKAGGLGNILVAQATSENAVNGHGAFATSITIDTANITGTGSNGRGLVPVLPVDADASVTTHAAASASNAYLSVDKVASKIDANTKWIDSKGVEVTMPAANTSGASVPYIQFDVWVLNSASSSVYFEFDVKNTTTSAALVNQLAYAATGIPTGVHQGDTFNANIVDALRMAYTQTNYVSSIDDSGDEPVTVYTGTTATSSTILDVAAEAKTNTITNNDVTFTSGGDANAYYNAVLGKNDAIVTSATTAINSGTKKQTITVAQNEETKLSFYIWLEGSDLQCFDSVSGQSFEFILTFTK